MAKSITAPKKERESRVGRPPVIDERVVGKLEEGFKNMLNTTDACLYAGISRDTFYEKLKTDKHFSDRIDQAKLFPRIGIRKAILNQIIKLKDGDLGLRLLERTEKAAFSPRIIQTRDDDLPTSDPVDERTGELIDKYKLRSRVNAVRKPTKKG